MKELECVFYKVVKYEVDSMYLRTCMTEETEYNRGKVELMISEA